MIPPELSNVIVATELEFVSILAKISEGVDRSLEAARQTRSLLNSQLHSQLHSPVGFVCETAG